ncbi:SseB family protein [Microbacterium sp. AZCO]|uniref:SseB family protein n=1 Tax=Microbacterium sp. AZCO TaxID=3142976 RepID=UPI0031F42FBD
MALFSRGKRDRDRSPESTPVQATEADTSAPQVTEPATGSAAAVPGATVPAEAVPGAAASAGASHAEAVPAEQPEPEAAASVGISVSSFRGVGAPPAEPSPAPAAQESTPGLRGNSLLAAALGELSDPPTPPQIINVARQLLQGHLFLRIKGDARALLSEGKQLPLAIATLNDENYVVAFSGGPALEASVRADGDTDTSAMAQPVLTVLKYVLEGPYAGLVLDPASRPATAVLRRDMLEKSVEASDPHVTIKTLLSGERTAATAAAVVDALATVPFWVAVSQDDEGRIGVAEVRTPEGERFLQLFSHPLEVVAVGRGERPAPMDAERLRKALRGDLELTGVIVDPGGPWIQLRRPDLGALIDG